MILIAVAVAALIAYLVIERSRELFCVSVRNGRVLVIRGRIPQGLLNDFESVVAQPPVARATIRAVRAPNGARLSASGVDEFLEQRLRNVFHIYPQARLSAAPVVTERSIGQVLGIAWLAWLVERSIRS